MTSITLRQKFKQTAPRIEVAHFCFTISDEKVFPPNLNDEDSWFLTEDLQEIIDQGTKLFSAFPFADSEWVFLVSWINSEKNEPLEIIEIELQSSFEPFNGGDTFTHFFILSTDKIEEILEEHDALHGMTPPSGGRILGAVIKSYNVVPLDLSWVKEESWYYAIKSYIVDMASYLFALANRPIEDSESEE